MNDSLKLFREKLSEKYRLSKEKLDESQLDDNLFYLLYGIDPNLTNSLNKGKKIIAVGSGKGGTGKTKTACDIAYLLSTKEKKTILIDGDFGGPNLFRRMEGLVNFNFDEFRSLKGEELIEYFRKNAPLTNNAKETLIDWYKGGLLRKLNLPHFLIYRDTTINHPDYYEKKLEIEDLLIDAGKNLKIIFGLLETEEYPLGRTPEKNIEDMISSVLSLPADKIIIDTSPGSDHGSLYLFNKADIRYAIPNLDMVSLEEPIGFVQGAIAHRLQMKINELPLLQKRKKEIDEVYKKKQKEFEEKSSTLCETMKIKKSRKEGIEYYEWSNYIKNNFINKSAYQINDTLFSLIKLIIDYGKVLYERDHLVEVDLESSEIERLQEDAPKLSNFGDLTKTGLHLFDFIQKYNKNDFVKKILKDFGETTYFIINNIPHGASNEAPKKLKLIIEEFELNYDVTLNQIKGVPFIFSLEESIMNEATGRSVPSAYYLSKLSKFDSPITKKYYVQLNKIINPLVM